MSPQKAFKRSRAAMWLYNGLLYIHGGECSDSIECGDVHKLENGNWIRVKASGLAPGPRSGHTGFSIGNKAYIWGGLAGDWIVHVLDLKKSGKI